MIKQLLIILAVFLLLAIGCKSPDQEKISSSPETFETAEVYFEQNSTDGDAEVVFIAIPGDLGLISFKVVASDNRIIIDYRVSDNATIGIRKFKLESPEPEDIEAVKKAYPSGVYRFFGTTTDGTVYVSEAKLDHTIPPAVGIVHPAHEMSDVGTEDLEIKWSSIADADSYLIEVEQEDSDMKIEATLPGSETSFSVPDKFLLPNTEYKVAVGVRSANGNLNLSEIAFTTTGD